jgi:hypothetical protein
MGSAGFEPAASSAQGWHHTMLDNDPSRVLCFLNLLPVDNFKLISHISLNMP